jgi:DNA primase
MIPDDVVAEVLRRTDIVELIGGYLPLRAAGKTHKGLCPFHTEKTPSFIVNPERQIFHCFGCGEGGDAISFLVKHERFTFLEAVRFLADRAGVSLPRERGGGPATDGRLQILDVQREALTHFRANLRGPEGEAARAYLAGRGLGEELIERFQLGYALPRWDGLLRGLRSRTLTEKLLEAAGLVVTRQSGSGYYDRFRHRVMIPIWDVSGKVVAFGGRTLDAQDVKYLNSPETAVYRKGTHLYGLNLAARAIREKRQAIVVEGYFDAIMLHAAGFEQAVATLGTALTTEQARLLGRYADTIVLLFDPDAPGIGAARRNLEQLINVELDWRIVLLPEGLDPDEYVRRHGAEAFQAALDKGQDLVEFFLDRRVSGLDARDPVQRARAADRLVEVVALIDNPIRREGYLQRVSQQTGLADRTLVEAVARQRSRASRHEAAPPRPSAPALPPTAEEQLVYIGLSFPEWRARIAETLRPEEIEDAALRRIYTEYVLPSPSGGASRPPMSLLPPEIQQRLSSLWVRDPRAAGREDEAGEAAWTPEASVPQTVEDCLARLAERRARARRESLRHELEAAERGGDLERALTLLREHPSVRSDRAES